MSGPPRRVPEPSPAPFLSRKHAVYRPLSVFGNAVESLSRPFPYLGRRSLAATTCQVSIISGARRGRVRHSNPPQRHRSPFTNAFIYQHIFIVSTNMVVTPSKKKSKLTYADSTSSCGPHVTPALTKSLPRGRPRSIRISSCAQEALGSSCHNQSPRYGFVSLRSVL